MVQISKFYYYYKKKDVDIFLNEIYTILKRMDISICDFHDRQLQVGEFRKGLTTKSSDLLIFGSTSWLFSFGIDFQSSEHNVEEEYQRISNDYNIIIFSVSSHLFSSIDDYIEELHDDTLTIETIRLRIRELTQHFFRLSDCYYCRFQADSIGQMLKPTGNDLNNGTIEVWHSLILFKKDLHDKISPEFLPSEGLYNRRELSKDAIEYTMPGYSDWGNEKMEWNTFYRPIITNFDHLYNRAINEFNSKKKGENIDISKYVDSKAVLDYPIDGLPEIFELALSRSEFNNLLKKKGDNAKHFLFTINEKTGNTIFEDECSVEIKFNPVVTTSIIYSHIKDYSNIIDIIRKMIEQIKRIHAHSPCTIKSISINIDNILKICRIDAKYLKENAFDIFEFAKENKNLMKNDNWAEARAAQEKWREEWRNRGFGDGEIPNNLTMRERILKS